MIVLHAGVGVWFDRIVESPDKFPIHLIHPINSIKLTENIISLSIGYKGKFNLHDFTARVQFAITFDSIKSDPHRSCARMIRMCSRCCFVHYLTCGRWMFVMKFNFENISICTRMSVIAIVNFTTGEMKIVWTGRVMCDTATNLIRFCGVCVCACFDWFSISSFFIRFMSMLRIEFPLR